MENGSLQEDIHADRGKSVVRERCSMRMIFPLTVEFFVSPEDGEGKGVPEGGVASGVGGTALAVEDDGGLGSVKIAEALFEGFLSGGLKVRAFGGHAARKPEVDAVPRDEVESAIAELKANASGEPRPPAVKLGDRGGSVAD